MKPHQKVSLFLAFLTMIFIFYISSKSNPPNPAPNVSYIPIIYHFGIFFLLGFFLFMSGKSKKEIFIIVFLISFTYAALDEFHQFFIPSRSAAISDFLTDAVGTIISFPIALTAKKIIS